MPKMKKQTKMESRKGAGKDYSEDNMQERHKMMGGMMMSNKDMGKKKMPMGKMRKKM